MSMKMQKYRLLWNGLQSHFLLPLSYRYGMPLMKPIRVHALPTSRCNYNCFACPCPGYREEYQKELSADQWIAVLKDLKSYLGSFHVNFSGGEPFLHKGIFEIARFCKGNGIYMGATTNASHINRENSDEILESFASLNISIDSFSRKNNDIIRNRKDAAEIVHNAITCLKDSMKRGNRKLPIYLKTVVMRPNLNDLVDIVKYCRDEKLSGVMFQPLEIYPATDKAVKERIREELWIDNLDELHEAITELIDLKRQGYPCLTDETTLRKFEKVFDRDATWERSNHCYIGYNAFMIGVDGSIQFICNQSGIGTSLGSLTEHSIRELWEGPKAHKIREKIKSCRKTCLLACKVERSLVQKAKIFFKL